MKKGTLFCFLLGCLLNISTMGMHAATLSQNPEEIIQKKAQLLQDRFKSSYLIELGDIKDKYDSFFAGPAVQALSVVGAPMLTLLLIGLTIKAYSQCSTDISYVRFLISTELLRELNLLIPAGARILGVLAMIDLVMILIVIYGWCNDWQKEKALGKVRESFATEKILEIKKQLADLKISDVEGRIDALRKYLKNIENDIQQRINKEMEVRQIMRDCSKTSSQLSKEFPDYDPERLQKAYRKIDSILNSKNL